MVNKITPSRITDINFLRRTMIIEPAQEQSSEVVCASARMVCTLATRPAFNAGEFGPRTSFAAAAVYSGRPVIGRYSCLELDHLQESATPEAQDISERGPS